MKRLFLVMTLLVLLFGLTARAEETPDFKGTWAGPLVREGKSTPLALEIEEAGANGVRGRLYQNGEEMAPLSEGKAEGNRLTFRVDTLDCTATLDQDVLTVTLTISHGRTMSLTMHRGAAIGHPSKAAAATGDSMTPPLPKFPPGVNPTPSKVTNAASRGALILVGGGNSADSITQRFLDLAGPDAPLVVIPTALLDKQLTGGLEILARRSSEMFHSKNVTILHTRDRAVAGSAEFVKPLQRARGVWILGGETGYLVKTYQGTRTERELKALLARGGVVGGTSAGAIIQTGTLVADDGHTLVPGFGLLSGALVWPHWSERRAEADLVKYTAQVHLPLGIGIDEATAIVVQGDTFEVVGDGHVGIVDGSMHDGKGYYLLSAGDRFDLTARAVLHDKKADAFGMAMSAYGPDRFRGNVLVARDGHVLYRFANTPETKFRIGSLTKQFTAAATLLLEERGALHTSDPIRKYLPELPPEWNDVTIWNLLTHTSGIPSDGSARLSFKPGEEWTYSNLGYQLLGTIIERVTKQSYGQFMAETILRPLGMSDSGADPELADLGGAGALLSTTDDLLKWQEALFGGKLLSPASFVKMTTPFRNGYGCALHLVVSPSGKHVFANEGRVPGSNAALQYYAEDKLVIAVLANLDTQVDALIARDLARAALAAQ
jgi:cyanophycinase